MKAGRPNRGQTLLELAIFGSLILVVFGTLLSYLNRANDQQYVQMKAFRQALQIANYGGISENTDGGGSVQLTMMENRRVADTGAYFKKGAAQATSASANILWSVPSVGTSGKSMTYYKINDNYSPNLRDILATDQTVDHVLTSHNTEFKESSRKLEDTGGITNIRSSKLKDTITSTLVDEDDNAIWTVTQGAYKDSQGQIRYSDSTDAVGKDVERSRTWYTPGY